MSRHRQLMLLNCKIPKSDDSSFLLKWRTILSLHRSTEVLISP